MVALTERELMVLEHLCHGLNNPEIADKLYISRHTVKAHLKSIYEKLNVTNRVQASIKFLNMKSINLNEL